MYFIYSFCEHLYMSKFTSFSTHQQIMT